MKSPRFPNALLSALEKSKGLRIRAGTGAHRFIGIWFVVVDGRVMVRSWSIRPEGWYRTFLSEPRGAIQVGKSEIAVRAVPVRNKGLRDLVDRAYLERYSTPGALKYAQDLCQAKSRATTTELISLTGED
jgi:hypothetical protein